MKSTGIKARPTTYKGVKMRSRLEAGFAMWLDQRGWSWAYEPECFANESGQWLPDFRVDNIPCVTALDGVQARSSVYVEVKPLSWGCGLAVRDDAVEEHNLMLCRMSAAYDSQPDALVVLAQEGTNPHAVHADGSTEPLDWTWTGLWPIDARRADGPWSGEWWKGVDAA